VSTQVDRRRFLALLSVSAAALGVPLGRAQEPEGISAETITSAEKLLGLRFTADERDLMLNTVKEQLGNYEAVRGLPLGNDVPPALHFSPLFPGAAAPLGDRGPGTEVGNGVTVSPERRRQLPFLSLRELGSLLRSGGITSEALTRMYLGRLKRFDSQLECVITLTEARALAQARRADEELRQGKDRGPLHGIPWGAKDLLAVKGYKTTWGAAPYRDQRIERDAEVVRKLDEAGAVLVAKLAVGALAWGDVWYGGVTKNPWNLEQGSSGSSAGPASATAAGLVGFSIGTETLGSIISPSQRCGVTGLRPTYGRVSREGAMALSWSMDKLGPICRSAEDCALVLDAIRGSDGGDETVIEADFDWEGRRELKDIRVGYDAAAFAEESDDKQFDQRALTALRSLGVSPRTVRLPDLPVGDMVIILSAEAAAAFDELTRSNRDDELTRQIENAWPNVFRAGRLIPAVEYIQANRARRILQQRFEAAVSQVDVYVHPTYGGSTLVATNLTGHPSVVLPNGFRDDGTPASICFTGRLFGESDLLAVAQAFQEKTGWHRRYPDFPA